MSKRAHFLHRLVYFVTVLFALHNGASATKPRAPSPTDIVQACTQTVLDYAFYRDYGPKVRYIDVFMPEGVFIMGEMKLTGHGEIGARYDVANAHMRWRHDMGDIRIAPDMTGVSRFVVYVGPKDTIAASPIARQVVGHYRDIFTFTDGVCKIAQRQVVIEFDSELSVP